MANEFATGAVHIFVRLPKSSPAYPNQIKLLGTSEQGPDRQTDRSYKEVRNDLSSQKPFDYVFAGGEEAVLSFVLTRWNDDVAQALEAAPVSGGIGFSHIFDHGTLMGQEGYALEIWYAFTFAGAGAPLIPNAAVAPFASARPTLAFMEGGRHYVQGLFWGPERDETGTRERKKHMVFKCWKKYSPTTQRFTLFDANMTGLPSLD